MFVLGILSWWYGAGWRRQASRLKERLTATMDYFSIDLLIRTLFSPFRQISAGKVKGPLNVQFRAFVDRLVSRIIGAMVRFFMMIIGSLTIALQAVLGGVGLLVWALVPLLPLVGTVLCISGWVPWSL